MAKKKKAASPIEKLKMIRELVEDGLMTDGDHHKQWFLSQIGDLVGIDIGPDDYNEGIAP
jgi:hypothetical protein